MTADGVFQGTRDVDHLPLLAQADRQTESRVLLPWLATTVLLPADALHADQASPQQSLIGDALYRLGAGIAFLGRALAARAHPIYCM